jgi:hypothetical protein
MSSQPQPQSTHSHQRDQGPAAPAHHRLGTHCARERWGALGLVGLVRRARACWIFPVHGPLCVLWELLGACLVLGAAACLKRKVLRRSPMRLALAAMSGAVLGQLWLRSRCPSHDAALHVRVYHVMCVLLIALLGLWPWRGARGECRVDASSFRLRQKSAQRRRSIPDLVR